MVSSIMQEFIERCDEYLICLRFAVHGIEQKAENLKKEKPGAGKRIWLGSNLDTDPQFHASMDLDELLEKSKHNGYFESELSKALLCTIYSLWDEIYRHKIAKVIDHDVGEIVAPLMGDLRKVRICIIHKKSVIPIEGMPFEVLSWKLKPGPLHITAEMVREFSDAVKNKMKVEVISLYPEAKEMYSRMTNNEKRSFDEWYKNHDNIRNNNPWPEIDRVLKRLGK
ncbi:hypothetical protein [Lelliottia wanjuensis]|uniref:Uncharacterized protein n=1 Tax=Lelliottia wanjuensis TaxID=3050585 RepID=A0AAP4FRG9_9ENTR|nr:MULTISPECIES: hypothetical protein [unclassified Lelliottia]MDK9362598.1 hypothetical protein [Lelliottia sp. V106_12]MDK9615481.1 hypothetical protein [Lelliottia sp. V106_9]